MASGTVQTGLIEKVQINNGTEHRIASTAYGICSTQANEANKTVQIDGFELVPGVTIHVKFTYDNTASTPPTLNVNGTGDVSIAQYDNIAIGTTSETSGWQAGAVISLTYDGTYWVRDQGYNTNTTYSTLTQSLVNTGSETTGKLVTAKIIKDTVINAINDLDVSNISGFGTGKTLATLTETDGKIAATFQDISITKSQVSDFPTSMTPTSHEHGNITNTGALQTTDITITDGDKLIVTDASNSGKIARASIAFDGSTETKALTPKGTWVTFNNYSHPTGDGNSHIPSTGTTSEGLYLRAGATANSAAWSAPTVWHGTCSTAADTEIKEVVCPNFPTGSNLVAGTVIFVYFSNTNNGAVADIKLRVNSTTVGDAKPIKYLYNGNAPANIPDKEWLRAGQTYYFSYDGTNWVVRMHYNTNTTPYGIRVYRDTVSDTAFNGDYPLLISRSLASAIATSSAYSNNIYAIINNTDATKIPTYNPYTGTLKATSFVGSFNGTAAQATADASGNTITTTYAPLASPALTGTPTAPTAANNTNNTQIATTAFVYNTLNVANAMLFKGTIGEGGTINTTANPPETLPSTHEAGWTYKVITAGTYAGIVCEVGDLIICVEDGTQDSNSDWTSVQVNDEGLVVGPASVTDNAIARFNGTTGKVIQESNVTIDDNGKITAPHTQDKTDGIHFTYGSNINFYVGVGNGNTNHGIYDIKASKWVLSATASNHNWTLNGNATNVTGTISVDHGGTNITSYTIGDILYASATTTLSKLGANTTTTRKFLRSVATTADTPEAPEWDTLTADDIPTITKSKISDFGHTHNYAGSDNAGGAANSLKNFTTTTNSSVGLEITTAVIGYISGLTAAAWNYQQIDGILYGQYYSDKWKGEIFQDYRTGQLSVRGKNNGTWQGWRRILDETNASTILGLGSFATISSLSFNDLSSHPTTLEGYEITDAATSDHTHGNITNDGKANDNTITGTNVEVTTEHRFLREDGTWVIPKYTTNTNTATRQRVRTTNANYSLLFASVTVGTADNTTAYSTYRNDSIYVNPSTGTIYATTFNGDLDGNASSANKLKSYSTQLLTDANVSNVTDQGLTLFRADSATTSNGTNADGTLLHFNYTTTTNWSSQLFIPDYTSNTGGWDMQWRAHSAATTWTDWKTILDSINYTTYTVKQDGTGATGSWGISITGNAANVTETVAIANGGTGETTANDAANALISGLPTWTGNPTDDTYLIRRSTTGTATYGQVKFSTVWNYIKGKGDSIYAPLASPALTGTPTAPTAANGTNTTQIATTAFVNNTLAYVNAMQFKGTLGTGGTITALPASHEAGDTYRVITPGTWAGKYCEEGTLIICVKDGTAAADADWTSVETNEDGAVIGPTESTNNAIVRWSGTSGRIIKNNSNVIIDDNGNTTIGNSSTTSTLDVYGATTLHNTLSVTSTSKLTEKVGIGTDPDNATTGDIHILTIKGNTRILNSSSTVVAHIDTNTASDSLITIHPHTPNTGSLGTSTYRWGKLYIGTKDSYGDAYQPIYWYEGVPAEVTPVQRINFTFDTTNPSSLPFVHSAITLDTSVIEIVVESGISYLNSPIEWAIAADTDNNNTPTLTLSATTNLSSDQTITGYIKIAHTANLTFPSNT